MRAEGRAIHRQQFWRLGLVLAAIVGFVALGASPLSITSSHAATSNEQTLADRYSPIVVVRQHSNPCGDGEPYLPVPVTAVLGRPDVSLKGPDGQVITTAPSAADLAGKGEGYYLDYPGEPLAPNCDYETWFRSTGAASSPTLYAHVATDPEHPGFIALQYWFFYVYNDWNDKHEGDWEMVQLLFNASSVDQALTQPPVSVAFAQHEGSEVADWNDPKLHKDGDHIAVYPGQGSHAAYYTQAHWFGKSAAAGFGCDNTEAPGVAVTPAIVLLPSGSAPATGDAAWLNFTGRWGQKAPSFNNGPTGPNTKTQWTEPVTWQLDEGRASATALPLVEGPAANAFCALSGGGSLLFLKVLDNPLLTVGTLLAIVIAIVLVWRSTRWRGSSSRPVDQERLAGQIVTSSFGVVRRHLLAFALIGGLALVALVVSVLLQSLMLQPVGTSDLARVGAPRWDWLAIPAALIPLIIVLPVMSIVVSACQHVVAADAEGRRYNGFSAIGDALIKPSGALAFLAMYVAVGVCFATLILIPLGLWIASRWVLGSPAAVMEGLKTRASLRRSSEITTHHRWRTLATSVLLLLISSWIGPLVGGVLLLVTHLSFAATNWIAAILIALLIPVTAVGLALQFFDLRRRHDVAVDESLTPVGS